MDPELSHVEPFGYATWKAPDSPPPRHPDIIEIDQEKIRGLQRRVSACEKQISDYRQKYKGQIDGQANFIDISLNRLGLCIADLRALEDPAGFEPEDLPDIKSVEDCIGDLETYLELCGRNSEFFGGECTKSGFFPDLNETADVLAKNGQLKLNGIPTTRIRYYIRSAEQRLEGSERLSDAA